jgi:predicted Zn finger-like uncharacterized protein
MNNIAFYCEECEMTSYIHVHDVGSHGFGVDCPNCNTHWDFTATGYDRPSEEE